MSPADPRRKSSEPAVPNQDETPRGGRPPVLTDAELLTRAKELNRSLGRPPKAAELIEASGGCQKKRALDAIQALRLELARADVRSELMFPRTIEGSLRGLMAEWLEHAATQLASRHQEETARNESMLERNNAQIEEQIQTISQLRAELSRRDESVSSLREKVDQLSTHLLTATQESMRFETLAIERERLLQASRRGSNPKRQGG